MHEILKAEVGEVGEIEPLVDEMTMQLLRA